MSDRLAEAERGVALGERHILEQRARIEQLERCGHDPTRAIQLLATFESSQRLFVECRDRLRDETYVVQDKRGARPFHSDESESFRQSFIEDPPLLQWRVNDRGERTWSSRQWITHTGLTSDESRGLGWLKAVHPDDHSTALALLNNGLGNGLRHADYRIRFKNGSRYRWFRTHVQVSQNAATCDFEWLCVSMEVDDLRAAQDKQSLQLSELQHRTRTTLGIVRSIARRTAETKDSVEDYVMHLEGRLDALARAQVAIAPAGVAMDALIAGELLAVGGREGGRIVISGPPLRLRSEPAGILALAIHELATNAMKFGALSPAGGKLNVSWQIQQDPSPRLLLGWKESKLTGLIRLPARRGFGVDLLDGTLAYELDAVTVWIIEPDGLLCTIEIPLVDQIIAPEPLRDDTN